MSEAVPQHRAEPRDRDHRRPPPPPFQHVPLGRCVMCGDPVLEGKRPQKRHWHYDCLDLWYIMSDPSAARRFVFGRDRGECVDCGAVDARINGDWDVDHNERLADANGDPRFWQPANLRTRCRANCHPRKTAAENRRARICEEVSHDDEAPQADQGRGP